MRKIWFLTLLLLPVFGYAQSSFVLNQQVQRGSDIELAWDVSDAVECRGTGDRLGVDIIGSTQKVWNRFLRLPITGKAYFDTKLSISTLKDSAIGDENITIGVTCTDRNGDEIFSRSQEVRIVEPKIDAWVESMSVENPLNISRGDRMTVYIKIGMTGLKPGSSLGWQTSLLNKDRDKLDECSLSYIQTRYDTTEGENEYIDLKCQINYFDTRPPSGLEYLFETVIDFENVYDETDEKNNEFLLSRILGRQSVISKTSNDEVAKSSSSSSYKIRIDKGLDRLYQKIDGRFSNTQDKINYLEKIHSKIDSATWKNAQHRNLLYYIKNRVSKQIILYRK